MGKIIIRIIAIVVLSFIICACATHKNVSYSTQNSQNEICQLREELSRKIEEYNKRIDSINAKLALSMQSSKIENKKIITFEPTLPIVPETGLPPVKSIEESYSSEINELKAMLHSIETRIAEDLKNIRDSMSMIKVDSVYISSNTSQTVETKKRPKSILILCVVTVLFFSFMVVYRYLRKR